MSIEQNEYLDSALQVAHEKGFSVAEASRMIDNYDSRAEKWIQEAKARATLRNTLPPMKQPTPANWSNAKTQIRNSFREKEQTMKEQIASDSAEIDAKRSSLQAQNKAAEEARTSAINSTRDEIEFVNDQIAKNSDSLKKDVAERADTGTINAARKKLWRTLKKESIHINISSD